MCEKIDNLVIENLKELSRYGIIDDFTVNADKVNFRADVEEVVKLYLSRPILIFSVAEIEDKNILTQPRNTIATILFTSYMQDVTQPVVSSNYDFVFEQEEMLLFRDIYEYYNIDNPVENDGWYYFFPSIPENLKGLFFAYFEKHVSEMDTTLMYDSLHKYNLIYNMEKLKVVNHGKYTLTDLAYATKIKKYEIKNSLWEYIQRGLLRMALVKPNKYAEFFEKVQLWNSVSAGIGKKY